MFLFFFFSESNSILSTFIQSRWQSIWISEISRIPEYDSKVNLRQKFVHQVDVYNRPLHHDACTINELAQVSGKSCLSSITSNFSPARIVQRLVCIRGHEKIEARVRCRACYFRGIHSAWSIRRRPWHLPCRAKPPVENRFAFALRHAVGRSLKRFPAIRKFHELKFDRFRF